MGGCTNSTSERCHCVVVVALAGRRQRGIACRLFFLPTFSSTFRRSHSGPTTSQHQLQARSHSSAQEWARRASEYVCLRSCHQLTPLTIAKGGKGRRGGGGGRGGGRGGAQGGSSDWRDYPVVPKENKQLQEYYDGLLQLPEDEKAKYWEACRRELPNSFRFCGSKG